MYPQGVAALEYATAGILVVVLLVAARGVRESLESGSRRCAVVGAPWCLRRLSPFSTFTNMSLTNKSPRAKHAETDPPPWHTYNGTLPTA